MEGVSLPLHAHYEVQLLMNKNKLNTDRYETFQNPEAFLEALEEETLLEINREDEKVFIKFPDGLETSFFFKTGDLLKSGKGLSYIIADTVGLIHRLNNLNDENRVSRSLELAQDYGINIKGLQDSLQNRDLWKKDTL